MARQPKDRSGASEARALSIGALSRATHIPVETLRTWERRYGSPKPVRKPSGHRAYPADEVTHLRTVSRLLAQGHRAGEILALPMRELERLLSLSVPGPAVARPPGPAPAGEAPAFALEPLMLAARELDREALMRELRAGWARLGPVRFLDEVAGAFMAEVGRAWEEKRIGVRHEHFASSCLSDFLRGVREPWDDRARGPRVVAATLPGDEHEGGLLIAALLLALRGHRVLYLGASTPIDQIGDAARAGNAEAVAISVSAAAPKSRSAAAIARLRRALPRRVPLWVGGAGAPAAARGVERFESLAALDARIAAAS